MQLNSDKRRYRECLTIPPTIPPLILILGVRKDQLNVPVFNQDCTNIPAETYLPFHGIYFLNEPLLTFDIYFEESCSEEKKNSF